MKTEGLDPQYDHQQALQWLWDRVIARAAAMRLDRTGPQYVVGADDAGMRTAPAGRILEWVDDCEARLGCAVAHFREAALDFVVARDGSQLTGVPGVALSPALGEAICALHMNHPVVRGLMAVLDGPAATANRAG